MFEEIERIVTLMNSVAGKRPHFEVGLSTAFGCSIEGPIAESKVVAIAEKLVALGVDEVGLSDTTGSGNPAQLRRLVTQIWEYCGREKLNGVHLHNTRGQGLANALAAVDLGLTTIDSSLGGIGGCPAAPGASGNIVTEDLVFMLEAMGLRTGIDIEQLITVRELVQAALPSTELYGFTANAGLPKGYTPQR
jgi:hydroxymethylglutaryl-CoA lyase